MTPKPPDGFASWLDWCVANADYRDYWNLQGCVGPQPGSLEAAAQDELHEWRESKERLISQVLDHQQELAALRARIAELEQEKQAAMDRADRHGRHVLSQMEDAKEHRERIANLEQQVAALADALEKCCDTISEWYVQDREGVETAAQARLLAYLNVPALSKARDLLANMKEQAALRAAGRKT